MTFNEMMQRAKGRDLGRDERRARSADRGERFEVLAFPSFGGSPIRTNWFSIAWVIARWRSADKAESRIIDRKTGVHRVL